MRLGTVSKPGDVIITQIQFPDSYEIKKRPALVLYEESDNVVVAGITSNLYTKGIPLFRTEGAIKDSVIKTNYIFTISKSMIYKTLFNIRKDKKKMVLNEITKKFDENPYL